ncbi:hypothetical protein DFO70_101373 [Cytobacillus firmus]|uniref:Ethanolamine utilization protein n=2 Tax=Cytobacillus TaxID=2675230 RepID=A0A366K7F3_CYTFI|nr:MULTISPECIES: hypothetical protein [Cytobacillus]RBP96561.1 hypothetical protein DFO70_101373 [Cytobacillus firmus]TDX45712.1 hypothetical protein DFO72_102183 [Cytobacillus oceanisediminis]
MIDRHVIEQIVEEVVKNLLGAKSASNSKTKHNILAVGDLGKVDKNLLEVLEENWNVLPYDFREEAELHTVMRVIFLDASQDLFVKGALGICDTPESELLSACIIDYVPVTLIPKTKLYKILNGEKKTNGEYFSSLMEYKEKLLKFGVEINSLQDFAAPKPIRADQPDSKKLITQRDVQECKMNEILADKQTIITPLARDTARELGKSIIVMDTKGAENTWKWEW